MVLTILFSLLFTISDAQSPRSEYLFHLQKLLKDTCDAIFIFIPMITLSQRLNGVIIGLDKELIDPNVSPTIDYHYNLGICSTIFIPQFLISDPIHLLLFIGHLIND